LAQGVTSSEAVEAIGTRTSSLKVGQGVGIRGQSGASVELVMGDLTKHGIAVHGTEDFTLQNIAIDWQQHTLGQGTVHSIDTAKKKVWVHNDAGFLTWDDGFFDEATATVYLRRTARQQTPPQCLLLPAADQPPAWGQANGLNWFRYQDFSNCPAGLAPGQKGCSQQELMDLGGVAYGARPGRADRGRHDVLRTWPPL
jgi:hypothetical protein